MKNKINIRFYTILFIIVLTGFWRVISHGTCQDVASNFTPIGALALFGGAYFKENWKAFLLPVLTLFLSDVFLMNIYFKAHSTGLLYDGWYWTYIGFMCMVIIGKNIKKVNVKNIFIAAIFGALAHWIIADFGVWIGGRIDITTGLPFTRDFQGLMKCYVLAIPFMRSMLLGNLIFGALLFGSFEYLKTLFPKLKLEKVSTIQNA